MTKEKINFNDKEILDEGDKIPINPHTGYELTKDEILILNNYYGNIDTQDLLEEIESTNNNLTQLLEEKTSDSIFKLLTRRDMLNNENGDFGLTKEDYIQYLKFIVKKAKLVLQNRLY